MGEEPKERAGNDRWKTGVAAAVVLTLTGLTVYVTVKTTEIPTTLALALLAAAAAGLWAYKLGDFKG